VLAFGMGGVAVELTRDFTLRPLPLREGDAQAMITETRGAQLLRGFRGAPAADVSALARLIEALSDFTVANAERIAEIDLNPIKAGPDGCVVVDALIVTRTRF
jgi:acetate---CoA ligase (ADP-forming)